MRRNTPLMLTFCAPLALACATPQPAPIEASFRGLGVMEAEHPGNSARAVSSDGRVVVGATATASGTQAFRWVDGAMTPLGELPIEGGSLPTIAYGVSGDGSVVAGGGASDTESWAWVWENGAFRPLPAPDQLVGANGAFGISGDGKTVVGYAVLDAGRSAIRWRGDTATDLDDLRGGLHRSFANAASDSGSVVVGAGHDPAGNFAVRWNGRDFEAITPGVASGVTRNGRIIVGGAPNPEFHLEAFRWTKGEVTFLGVLPRKTDRRSRGIASAEDGERIVGWTNSPSGGAFVWDVENGMRSLKDVLVDGHGLDLEGWHLTSANALTPDGQTIVGDGVNPDGAPEGWIATLPR